MVKISDIFKKEGDFSEEPEKNPQGEPRQKIPISEIQKESSHPASPQESISIKDASSEKLRKPQLLSSEDTQKLYQEALTLIRSILDRGLKNEPIESREVKELVEKFLDQITAGNTELIGLTNNSSEDNYLYAHSVNVCILSIKLGAGVGYNREQLIELGVASFLHDIGMVKVADIIEKTSKLTKEEYEKIKNHPVYGVDMLGLVKDISKATIYVAKEHHEWPDGKGYPQGLKGNQIEEYAKIVSTADTYEALTHPRKYRERLHPFDALRDIMKDKGHFDFKFLKVLIEEIGIFPVGSWVQLSTNEKGTVLSVNKKYPLKPTVKIIFDSQERRLSEEKIINLVQYPTLFIKKPLHESDLPGKNNYLKSFLLLILPALCLIWPVNSLFCASNPREETISTTLNNLKNDLANPETAKSLEYFLDEGDELFIEAWQILPSSFTKEGKRQYNIYKGDVLEISVWQWPDLLKEVIVSPEGTISFPLVGEVEAEGLTLQQLRDILTEKLKDYIKSPQVSIIVKQYGVSVYGKAYTGKILDVPFVKIDDLSTTQIIRPDGKISFSFLGDIDVKGLTLEQLTKNLTQKLSVYIKNIKINASIKQFGGNKVAVLGEVTDPGVYDRTTSMKALDVISTAGGYSKDAILGSVFVLRGNLDNPQVIKINLMKAISGKDFSQNILLKPRDIVYVPKSHISNISYVLTQILSPLSSSSSAVTSIKVIRETASPKK